jgi:lysophospholipase
MSAVLRGTALGVLVLLVAAWLAGFFVFRDGPHSYAEVSGELSAEAQAYLDKSLVPMPQSWSTGMFQVAEGIELEAGYSPVANAKGTVILVPGYTAPLELYGAAVASFNEAGYNLAAVAQRGQGRSYRELPDPEKGWMESYGVLAADLAAFIQDTKQRFDGPYFLYGVSQGAHISMRALAEHELDIEALSVAVPMVEIDTSPFPYVLAGGVASFYTLTGLGDVYAPGRGQWTPKVINWGAPTQCNKNPDTAYLRDALFALEPELRSQAPSNRWVMETMRSTSVLKLDESLSKIGLPVLMATAGQDSIVKTDASAKLCERLNMCERNHYPDSSHCIDAEDGAIRDTIIARSIAHFDQMRAK